ncbi:hypothetical protein CHS0354_028435 [Potamilus streckersoni]|uniref:Importin N-terminal domain-containing protein n=1 Tax=Potamilus streckersoni TaxID=2493646 RepID=A0AAE0SH70_9BIVA|nr:hypothetical protein CHS0354_028435 [Potamilus streckersoni]
MASDQASLQALEALMNEFFDGRTTNNRKREIEEILENFSQTRDAWKHSLFYLANTQNEYVLMYCMTVIENLINRRWMGMSAEDKGEIRTHVNRFLLEQHRKVPSFIRNKLVKVVVDIGRIDWPHFYPDFFTSILQLIQQSDAVALGITLLQTSSEELACPREDLSMARKEELHKLLLQQIPTILGLLNNILESVLEKHHHLVAATPPPSPTQGERRTSQRPSSVMLFSSSPLKSDSFLGDIFKSPGKWVQVEALPPLDPESQQLCVLALSCLSHYFSWIPLSATITPALLSTIFHFAGFGCQSHGNRSASTTTANFSSSLHELGILAMNCINELLSKNCVPQEFEDYLLQMFQQTFYLLQKLTKDSSSNSSGNRLTELDDRYVEKFTDFLRLFVSIHLRRFESNANFPVLEFLALLFKYTFRQPTNEGLYNCLDIWTIFLDYLHTKMKDRMTDAQAIVLRYKEALTSLVTHILQKLQFRYNQSQLEELDDEMLDDNEETEWQHFLRQCLEVIAKLAEIVTAETFQILFEMFQEVSEIYLGLEQYIVTVDNGRHLNVRAENEIRRLHCSLRDLSSLLQGLGRLAEHFIGENFTSRLSDGQVVIERLVQMAVFGTRLKLFELTSTDQSVIQTDFVEVHAQSLAAVKAYAPWLSQLYMETQQYNQEREKFTNVITLLINSVLPLFSKGMPEKIVHSAAHLLLSLMTTVRPAFGFQLDGIQQLFQSAGRGHFSQISMEVQLLMYRALSLYLILPWPNLSESDQNWSSRAANHHDFTHQLAVHYLQLKDTSSLINNKATQDSAKPVIRKTLHMFQDWVASISGEVVKTKQICYQSLQEIIQVTLAIFPVFIHQPDVVDNIMSFFLALFQGLRVQMGVPFTEQIIQTFMNLFSKDQLSETIAHESSAAYRAVEKFLTILEIICQEPGAAFKRFLPNIISTCMEQIYPIIAQRQSPDIKQVFYHLLHELLINNWRYFFKGSVLAALHNQTETLENMEQFVSIMQTIFQEMMLFQFMNVLVQVLIHKSHDLLQEEIVVTVYNMASVDFEKFYVKFMPQFLVECEGLDENQKSILGRNFKMDRDLPTFTQSLHRFVNDLRYYRLVNSSLPAGSFSF